MGLEKKVSVIKDKMIDMDAHSLKVRYDYLLKDVSFDKLELELGKPNIFEVLNIVTNEIKHSNFLSWILDPRGSHKLGDIFLKRFLREAFSSNKFVGIDQIDVESLDLGRAEIIREWEHIDLLIKTDTLVVCIENKVLSKEHSNQLTRYKATVEKSFPDHIRTYVYLSPDGHQPIDEADYFEVMSYEFIVETLERVLHVYDDSINEQVLTYIKDYVTIVKRKIMKTDELIQLSQKIYSNHKELLDFIYENKPDPMDSLRVCFLKQIQERGWVTGSENKMYARFLTPKLSELIYYNQEVKNGWKNGESFLFEIIFYPPSNSIIFKTVISPSDDHYDSLRLEAMLMEVKGAKPSRGGKWLVNHTKKSRFNYDEVHRHEPDDLIPLVNEFLDFIAPLVGLVEAKLLSYEAELKQMKAG